MNAIHVARVSAAVAVLAGTMSAKAAAPSDGHCALVAELNDTAAGFERQDNLEGATFDSDAAEAAIAALAAELAGVYLPLVENEGDADDLEAAELAAIVADAEACGLVLFGVQRDSAGQIDEIWELDDDTYIPEHLLGDSLTALGQDIGPAATFTALVVSGSDSPSATAQVVADVSGAGYSSTARRVTVTADGQVAETPHTPAGTEGAGTFSIADVGALPDLLEVVVDETGLPAIEIAMRVGDDGRLIVVATTVAIGGTFHIVTFDETGSVVAVEESAVTPPADTSAATPTTVGAAATAPATTAPAATTTAPTEAVPATVTIDIVNFTFSPAEVTIAPGTTVVWTNSDDSDHAVLAVDGLFAGPRMDEGGTFSFTFAEPGTFAYICSIHPEMSATIIVA